MIRIAISTDAKGHPYHATLIASILRRTSMPVHVRCWCRGFLPKSFEVGPLKMEFLPATEEVTGKFPGYVGPAVFDRLRVIREATDWDTCLIMDYDQLALCDLAPLFEKNLGDYLLAAKMQGPGVDMAYAMRAWIQRPLPAGWEHVAEYPYFSMGPLLNLDAMRKAGTWDKLVAAHQAFGVDEQLSLTAATEGRTTGFDRKWNLFPKSDIQDTEVPEGVIHWLGWPKPWHRNAKVWRPDIWESERSSWEHLRMGLWEKPLAMEIEPDSDHDIRELVKRGWRVKIFRAAAAYGETLGGKMEPAFPDVEEYEAGPFAFQSQLRQAAEHVDRIRIGPWENAAEWLKGMTVLPEYLVLKGALGLEDMHRLRGLGYTEEVRIKTATWPTGGPLPRILNYHAAKFEEALGAGEELYLKRSTGDRPVPQILPIREPQHMPRAMHSKRIGILVIATGRSRIFARFLLQSIRRNFLTEHEITIFLFSDGPFPAAADVKVIPVKYQSHAALDLQRHATFLEHEDVFLQMDYLYTIGTEMRVVSAIGEEIFGDLVATLHPGFHDKPRAAFPYERRKESSACVPDEQGSFYYTGSFRGGRREHFLHATRVITKNIAQDELKGMVAHGREESHWNRFLIDHPPSLSLPPTYCCYPDERSVTLTPKIFIVPDNAMTYQDSDTEAKSNPKAL